MRVWGAARSAAGTNPVSQHRRNICQNWLETTGAFARGSAANRRLVPGGTGAFSGMQKASKFDLTRKTASNKGLGTRTKYGENCDFGFRDGRLWRGLPAASKRDCAPSCTTRTLTTAATPPPLNIDTWLYFRRRTARVLHQARTFAEAFRGECRRRSMKSSTPAPTITGKDTGSSIPRCAIFTVCRPIWW